MAYTNAYCDGTKIKVLNEKNTIVREFNIGSEWEAIGPAVLAGDTITILVKPARDDGRTSNRKILTFTATGVFRSIRMA